MLFRSWAQIVHNVTFDYAKDNYFTELKNNEIAEARINLARNFQDMTGKYISHNWVRKNILQQSDDIVEQMDAEINAENQSQDPRWINPTIEQNMQMLYQHQAEQEQAPLQGQGQQQQSPEEDQKTQQVRQALDTINIQKQKGSPKNRSIQDQSAYKQAVQIVAKNPDIVQQITSAPQ